MNLPDFDTVAERSSNMVARAPFFVACVLLIVVWAPSYAFLPLDTWQLIINTITTIVTFLLVALLQNTTDRSMQAVNHKLDALLDGLATLMGEEDSPPATREAVEAMRDKSGVDLEPSRRKNDTGGDP